MNQVAASAYSSEWREITLAISSGRVQMGIGGIDHQLRQALLQRQARQQGEIGQRPIAIRTGPCRWPDRGARGRPRIHSLWDLGVAAAWLAQILPSEPTGG